MSTAQIQLPDEKVRLSLDLSPELNNLLEYMATETHSSKSDILRKSIVLMEVALKEKSQGNHLSIVSKNQEIIKEIVGF